MSFTIWLASQLTYTVVQVDLMRTKEIEKLRPPSVESDEDETDEDDVVSDMIKSLQEEIKTLTDRLEGADEKHEAFLDTVELNRVVASEQLKWLGMGVQKQADGIRVLYDRLYQPQMFEVSDVPISALNYLILLLIVSTFHSNGFAL